MWPGGSDTVSRVVFRGVSADTPSCLQWQRGNEAGVGEREREKDKQEEEEREKKATDAVEGPTSQHTHSSLASLFPSHFSHASESSS